MKKKITITIICLSVVFSLMACGNNNNSTEAGNTVEVSESTETEVVATETQEMQETEMEEEEIESFENYKELETVPVDGRDGSKENPYQVGDTIHFPKVMIEYNTESLETMYTSLTVVVEEATSEYVKISYKFGVDSWEELDWENWSMNNRYINLERLFFPFRFDGEDNQLGNPLSIINSLNDVSDTGIIEADKTEGILYYQGDDRTGCTEDTAYLMLIYYLGWNVPEEEQVEYFNCTFVEVQ